LLIRNSSLLPSISDFKFLFLLFYSTISTIFFTVFSAHLLHLFCVVYFLTFISSLISGIVFAGYLERKTGYSVMWRKVNNFASVLLVSFFAIFWSFFLNFPFHCIVYSSLFNFSFVLLFPHSLSSFFFYSSFLLSFYLFLFISELLRFILQCPQRQKVFFSLFLFKESYIPLGRFACRIRR
jgi:hypothetical protein